MVAMDYIAGGARITLPPMPESLRAYCAADLAELAEAADCDVCDGTGVIYGAAGRAGRPELPCLNCDSYDRMTTAAEEAAAELMED